MMSFNKINFKFHGPSIRGSNSKDWPICQYSNNVILENFFYSCGGLTECIIMMSIKLSDKYMQKIIKKKNIFSTTISGEGEIS